MQNNIDDARQSAANPVVGCSLAADDRVSGAAHFSVDFLPNGRGEVDSAQPGELLQRHSSNRRHGPGEDFRVSMFTNHVSMHMMWIDTTMRSEQAAESRCVQRGS